MYTNACFIEGKLNRVDARKGMSKAGAEFISVTFTLDVNGSQIQVEVFSMKNKKDGSELNSYKGLYTLISEGKALRKTIREIGETESVEIEDETIVENIEDADKVKFDNWSMKYCRFEENMYLGKDGQVAKNIRVQAVYPSRIQEGKPYEEKAEFSITGVVKIAPYPFEKDEKEYLKFVVTIPTYNEAWGDREASVTLHDIEVQVRDEQGFDYVQDEFQLGSVVHIEGDIIRRIERVETVVEDDSLNRGGWGSLKHMNDKPKFSTNVDSAIVMTGGFVLIEEDMESLKEFEVEIWTKGKEEKEQKEKDLLENNNGGFEKQSGFGRSNETKKVNKTPKLPF